MGSHRILFAALGLLLVSPCLGLAEVVFFEEFGPGWDGRWVYSSDEKYSGRFETETPAGLDGPALKVRRLIAADYIAQIALPPALGTPAAVRSSAAQITALLWAAGPGLLRCSRPGRLHTAAWIALSGPIRRPSPPAVARRCLRRPSTTA